MSLEIHTERLRLLLYTQQICNEVLSGSTTSLLALGIHPADGWPDWDTMDTLPRILSNLQKVPSPTGFESWMIIHKDSSTLIGDIGFKGLPNKQGEIDLGYGIISQQTGKGYAKEAATGLIKWALQQPGVTAITASCASGNHASQRILTYLNLSKVIEDQEMMYWRLDK